VIRRVSWLFVTLAGCGGDRVGFVQAPIEGGVVDSADRAVVAVRLGPNELCSGVLVGRAAVLTARHCVGGLLDASPSGGVSCGKTRFSLPAEPTNLRVSGSLDVRADDAEWLPVSAVLVPAADAFCGNDLAVLALASPYGEAPLSVRREGGTLAGEPYSAVGFGATDGTAAEYGVRRRRDGLSVDCVGDACGKKSVSSFEWLGPEGTCAGDSGGPAIDAEGRVIGVVSRSLDGCSSIVYEEPSHHRRWLEETLLTLEGDAAASVQAHGGCAAGQDSTGAYGSMCGAAAVLALTAWARRRS